MAQLDKNHLLLRSNFSFLYRTSIADERPYQIQVLTAKLRHDWGRGGGQVVSMLAFHSDEPSSNPAVAKVFFYKFVFEKSENNQKEAHVTSSIPSRYWFWALHKCDHLYIKVLLKKYFKEIFWPLINVILVIVFFPFSTLSTFKL